ncbi:7-bladed beta-propeller protein YncE [Buttiauxella agrestis]|uniref:7-bladed beta-propeller protein YncE n=1 Tax=Buttiauxella agrestis TaxID=82977 RepID=UPI003975DD05
MPALPQTRLRVLPALILSSLLFSTSLFADTSFTVERKPVGKGAYEMAYSADQSALYVATSQSRKTDKGGVVYRLDPATLEVTQAIHNNLKPFGVALNKTTGTLFLGNTTSSAVTAINSKTGDVIKTLVVDETKRTETTRPLMPRQLVVDEATNTLYMGGLGESSVLWVIDGGTLTLRDTIKDLGKMATGLAIDAKASRIYMTNADNEFIVIDSKTDKVVSRTKLDTEGEHFYLNIALDAANNRAFVSDSKTPQLLVVDTKTSKVLNKVDVPLGLDVLFNPVRNEIYVTHRKAGKVSVIDAKSYKVLETIDTPALPNSLALSPDGQQLYVSVKQPGSREKEPTSPDDIVRISFK